AHARPARLCGHRSGAVNFENHGRSAAQIELAPPRLTWPNARRVRGQNYTFALLETGENRRRCELVATFARDIDRDEMRSARLDTEGARGAESAQRAALPLNAGVYDHPRLFPRQRHGKRGDRLTTGFRNDRGLHRPGVAPAYEPRRRGVGQ